MASSGNLGALSIDVLANIASMVNDLSNAQAANARAAREFQSQWQESISGVQESFKALTATIGIGFSLEKISEFTKSVVEAGLQIYDLNLKTGISAQTLSSYSVAAAEAGVSIDVFGNTLSKMARSANDAAHGAAAQTDAFRQLGVSVTDASGHLKGADELLGEVAVGLDKLQNGLGKTAIVTEIFGRGGAALIPLLSDLGEGVDAARIKAEKFGLAINDAQAKALKQFDVTVTDAGLAIRGAFTQALLEALPALQRAATAVLDFVQNSQGIKTIVADAASAIVVLGNNLQTVATVIKDIAELVAASIFLKLAEQVAVFAKGLVIASGAALTLKTTISGLIPLIASAQIGTAIGEWANQFNVVKQAGAALVGVLVIGWDYIKGGAQVAFAAINSAWDVVASAIRSSFASLIGSIATGLAHLPGQQMASAWLQSYADSLTAANAATKPFVQSLSDVVSATNKQVASDKENIAGLISYYGTMGKATSVLTSFTVEQNEAKKATDGFAKSTKTFVDQSGEALLKFSEEIDKLAATADGPYGKAMDQFAAGMKNLEIQANAAAIGGANVDAVIRLWQEGEAILTQKVIEQTDAQYVLNTAMQAVDATVAKHLDLIGKTGTELAVEAEYQKLLNEALKGMQSVMGPLTAEEQARIESLHGVAAAIVAMDEQQKASTELLKSWANTLDQDVTGSFNNFLTDLEHGKSVVKDFGDFFTTIIDQMIEEAFKLEIVGPLINSAFGLSGSSALPTGQIAQGAIGQILGGGGTAGTLLSKLFGGGGSSTAGTDPDFLSGGALSYAGPGSSFGYGGAGSAALGAAGGLYAGYSEYNAAGGGIAGLAGGAAYGIGTFALGGAISAGVSAAAAGGISAGLSAGFAAIPVVGWIALAAMGLNAVTHGGLFGTSATPYGSEENLSVGSGGASISAAIDEKGKKALFQGSYWKTVSAPVDQQTQDGVAAFFTGLQAAANAEAMQFGQTTGTIVAGTFHETFDKAGKMLTEVSTVAGQQFSESITDFQNRVLGDTLLANMGDASAEAEKIAQQWQASAADLLAGAEFLSQAQLDISQGHALVQGDTLTQLTDFLQTMQVQGESLIQTYARLSVETTDVQNIMGNLGLDTGKTGEALVKFDDDMTKAAGSLDNLNTLWNNYYSEFYSQAEQQAITVKGLQKTVTDSFTAIGEDPSESMAKFRQDFEAALPNLTPEQVVAWLQAGDALYKLDTAIGSVNDSATTTAQTLMDSAATMAASIQKVEQDAQSLSTSLFGSNLDQLKAQQAAYGNSTEAIIFKQALQPQIDAAQAQQDAAAHLGDASKLLNDFAQIGVVSGQSLQDFSAEFHAPLDKLATYLGTDAAGLQKQFAADEALAAAQLNIDNNTKLSAEYLQDIKDILSGSTPTFGLAALENAANGIDAGQSAISTNKGRGGTATPVPITSPDVVDAVNGGTQQQTAALDKIASLLAQVNETLRGMGAGPTSAPLTQRGFRTFVGRQMG